MNIRICSTVRFPMKVTTFWSTFFSNIRMILSSTMVKCSTILVINTRWFFSTPKRHWLTKWSLFMIRWRKSKYYVTGVWNQSQQYHFTSAPNLINIVILFFMSGAPSYPLKWKTTWAILSIILNSCQKSLVSYWVCSNVPFAFYIPMVSRMDALCVDIMYVLIVHSYLKKSHMKLIQVIFSQKQILHLS